jgi:hypothetical protein
MLAHYGSNTLWDPIMCLHFIVLDLIEFLINRWLEDYLLKGRNM